MKLLGTCDKFEDQFLAEIDVNDESAEFIDNEGNELYQPKIIQRKIIGDLIRVSPLWSDFLEFYKNTIVSIDGLDYLNVGMQIDFDIYLSGHIHINLANLIITIIAVQTPLIEEETNFSEEKYLNRVKERNFGKRVKVRDLCQKLKLQEEGLISQVTYNDVREIIGESRELNFNELIPQNKCNEMMTEILEPELTEVNRIDAGLDEKY